MSMDFLNELNSVTKTKAEAERDKQEKELSAWRYRVISEMKIDIKNKAASGEFVNIGSKKRISSFIDPQDVIYSPVRMFEDKILQSASIFKCEIRKICAKPLLLSQLCILKQELEKEGLKVIKMVPAFKYKGMSIFENEITYESKGYLNYYEQANRYIYYEVEY